MTLSSYLTRVSHLIDHCEQVICSIAQALPNSLRVLETVCVPTEVLVQLTALERLTLTSMPGTTEQPTCSLSALQRLTLLDLHYITDEGRTRHCWLLQPAHAVLER